MCMKLNRGDGIRKASPIFEECSDFTTTVSIICIFIFIFIFIMSPRLQFLQVATSLFAFSHALPNVSPPQITPVPSIGRLEVKRAESGNETLVGYYTVSSGAPWETNTCGESATWSTSGQYGACAGKPSQSLYTSCSGNVLVGGAGLTTQSW